MQRLSITLDDPLVEDFERFMTTKGYANRSEAIRDLIRERLEKERLTEKRDGHCMATLTYVYNHHERELASRLTHVQHEHHDLTVSTTHVHLDHDNCMETAVLRGTVEQVEDLANAIISQPGVRHGQLYLLPVQIEQHRHAHGDHTQSHTHVKPLT